MAAMKKQITPYSDEELKILLDWYPLVGGKAVVQRLKELGYNRSFRSVVTKASKLGLKSPIYQKNCVTSFKKGMASHNKGQKMQKSHYEKCAPTMFKKGVIPHNTLHDGVITTRHLDGKPYLYIRLGAAKWEPLHRYTWKEKNGEIPIDMLVTFIDGDYLNCTIENLRLISRADNARRNYNLEKVLETNKHYTDKQIAGRLGKNNRLLRTAILQQPEIIDLARAKIHLDRAIKKSKI
jgi:hypothetical protein